MISNNNLPDIKIVFDQTNNHAELIIKNDDWEYQAEVKTDSILQGKTPSNFKEFVGEFRLQRIFERRELGLDLQKLSQQLTKEAVEKIFLGVADVRRDDLEEAAQLKGKKLKNLSVKEVDELYDSLIPFKDVNDLFLGKRPQIQIHDRAKSSGKGLQGLKERVSIIHTFRKRNREPQNENTDKSFVTDVEVLTSRLGDREPTIDTVVRRRNGYFVYDRIFSGGGAFVSVLKDVTGKENPLIVCRGMAATRSGASENFSSGINGVVLELGFYGIEKVWQEIYDYLTEQQIKRVDILGKSLGGAHAQYLSTLIEGTTDTIVNSLSTYCSVGVPQIVHKCFQKAIKETRKRPLRIHVIRNVGDDKKDEVDYIPFVGGNHLGLEKHQNVKVHLSHLRPLSPVQDDLIPSKYTLKKLFKFFISFGNAHLQQTTLLPQFDIQKVALDQQRTKLKWGSELEGFRKTIAKVFDVFTFRKFNQTDFSALYTKFHDEHRLSVQS